MDHLLMENLTRGEDHQHLNSTFGEAIGVEVCFEDDVSKDENETKNNTKTLNRSRRSLLAQPLSKTSSTIIDIGPQIDGIIQRMNTNSNGDQAAFKKIFGRIGRNYDFIEKNFYAITHNELDLETNVPIKFDSEFMRHTLSTVEQTKDAMHQELREYLKTSNTSEFGVGSIVTKLDGIVKSFANDVKMYYSLSQWQRIDKLKEENGILKDLEHAGSFIRVDTLNSLLYSLFNFGFSKPKNAEDKDAFAALSALYYGSQIYVATMFFLLDLYAYIINYYHAVGDIEKFNKKLLWLKMNFSSFRRSLVYRLNNDPLLYGVIDKLEAARKNFWVDADMSELLQERIEFLKNIIPKIREMDEPVIEYSPEQLQGVPRIKNKGIIHAPIGAWKNSVNVRYTAQYQKDNKYSTLGEWSESTDMGTVACPYVTVPTAWPDQTRLIYRQINKDKPQLVAVLEKRSKTEFRDIDRDLYNAASETTRDRAINDAEILIRNGGNVNKKFNQGRRAIHAAAESGNTEFAKKFILGNNTTDVDVRDVNGHTPTMIAAQAGEENFVELLVKNGADVNIGRYADKLTPLHAAVFEGYVSTVNALMTSNTININAKDIEGFTPLHNAVFGEILLITALASNSSTEVNAKSKQGLTPLHLASINNNRAIAEELMKTKKVDINAKAEGDLTPLHFSSALGHVEMVMFLTSQDEININAKSIGNWTPLHLAISLRKENVALELLKSNNTTVNLAADGHFTPLHIAAATGQNKVLLRLLENKAPLEEKTTEGLTLLHLAAMNGNQETISTLLSHGANIEVKSSSGLTPLHLAASSPNGNLDTMKLLINKGANLSAVPSDGETFLHLAARSGLLDNVKYFVEKNYNVNAKDKLGLTPLHLAAESGGLDAVKYLITKGANTTTKSNGDKTILHFAVSSGNLDVVKYFTKKDADVNAKDENSDTPVFIAVRKNYYDIIRYLIRHTKVDVNVKYDGGRTLLHLAVLSGNLGLARDCLRKGANVYEKYNNGYSPLLLAASKGDLNMVQLMRNEKWVDFNVVCNLAARPLAAYHGHVYVVEYFRSHEFGRLLAVNDLISLIVAVQQGRLDVIKYLTKKQLGLDIHSNQRSSLFSYYRQSLNSEYIANDVSSLAKLYSVTESREPLKYDEVCTMLLLLSVEYKRLHITRYLVEVRHADVNAKYKNGRTLLHHASANGSIDIVKYLTNEKHVNMNVEDDNGMTPLLFAAKNNHFDIVKFLIEKGASRSTSHFTTLDFAAANGNLDMAKYLREKGDNVNSNNKGGRVTDLSESIPWIKKTDIENTYYDGNPLGNAAKNDHLDMVKYLVKKGANINSKNENGDTPLCYAAKNGNLEMVKYLLSKGANPNPENGLLLHIATVNGRLNIVEYLVNENHAKFVNGSVEIAELLNDNVKNGYLSTAKYLIENGSSMGNDLIHKAAENGHLDIVKYFIDEKHVSVNVLDSYNRTPIHYAASEGYLQIVKYLLAEKHADMTIKGTNGKTPLSHAVLHPSVFTYIVAQKGYAICDNAEVDTCLTGAVMIGDLNLLKHLTETKKFNINLNYSTGATLLQQAMLSDQVEIVKYLIEKGADVNVRYPGGDLLFPKNITSLHIAAARDNLSMVEYLIKKGADVNAKGDDLLTPRGVAEMCCNTQVGDLIRSKGGKFVRRSAEFDDDDDSSSTEVRTKRSPWNDNYPSVLSGGSKPSSWLNSFAQAIVNTVTRLSQFVPGSSFIPAIDMMKNSQPSKTGAIQNSDASSTVLLLDVFIRKFTGQKYISTAESSISLAEATGDALCIIEDFENMLKQAAKKSDISLDNLNIDFIEMQKQITRKIVNGKFDEVLEVLSLCVEKAELDKNKFMIEFDTKVCAFINKTMQQALVTGRNNPLKGNAAKNQLILVEPSSSLNINPSRLMILYIL